MPLHQQPATATATADRLSGLARLPPAFVEASNIAYGQPVVIEVLAPAGRQHTYLCSASLSSSSGSAAIDFDTSLQCGLVAAGAQGYPVPLQDSQQQLLVSVTAVTTKVVTATAVEVLVPEQLLLSAVPAAKLQQRLVQKNCTLHLSSGVCCRVLDVSPAAPQPSTVYRVVPSTAIQLTTDAGAASSSADTQLAQAAAATSAGGGKGRTPASTKLGGSRTSSGTSTSKPRSSRPGSAASSSKGAQKACSPGTRKASSSSSSTDASTRADPAGDSGSPVVAAGASGSMFDLLEALQDD